MERNRLFIALGVLVMLGVATVLVFRPRPEGDDHLQDPWHHLDRAQISKIIIQRPGDAPAVELEKRDSHWFMNRPATGPADEQAVNDALDAMTQMHVASIAAREAASHADLEVDSTHAIHVQLMRGAATDLDLWVGKNLDSGTAVRSPSGPTVFRVDRSVRFSLSKEPREWRDRNITHVERAHVRSVEWQNPRGTYHFDRNGDTWTGAAANPPIAHLDTARLNQTITNLLELRAMDFAAPGADVGITEASPRVTITPDTGSAVTLQLGSNAAEGEVYVQRAGAALVYTMARSHAAEVDLTPTTIETPPPPPDAGADAGRDAGSAAPRADASLSPEIMEQIRRQLQQRGMNMPH